MAGVRTLLARTRRLEATKVHPMFAALGGEAGWAALQADAEAGMAAGQYDSRDMPVVVEALRLRTHSQNSTVAARAMADRKTVGQRS